jgi:hypothetical protein
VRLGASSQCPRNCGRPKAKSFETTAELTVAILRAQGLELDKGCIDASIFAFVCVVEDFGSQLGIDAAVQQALQQPHPAYGLSVEHASDVELRVGSIVDVLVPLALRHCVFDRIRRICPIAQFLNELGFAQPLN